MLLSSRSARLSHISHAVATGSNASAGAAPVAHALSVLASPRHPANRADVVHIDRQAALYTMMQIRATERVRLQSHIDRMQNQMDRDLE
eukprot:514557-Alexandrium_andersonii.AAC.1